MRFATCSSQISLCPCLQTMLREVVVLACRQMSISTSTRTFAIIFITKQQLVSKQVTSAYSSTSRSKQQLTPVKNIDALHVTVLVHCAICATPSERTMSSNHSMSFAAPQHAREKFWQIPHTQCRTHGQLDNPNDVNSTKFPLLLRS